MRQTPKAAEATRRRFIAKQRDRTWWVYDKDRGSWPRRIPGAGLVRTSFRTEAEAQAEADRVEEAV